MWLSEKGHENAVNVYKNYPNYLVRCVFLKNHEQDPFEPLKILIFLPGSLRFKSRL